jgi:hypothetical protein
LEDGDISSYINIGRLEYVGPGDTWIVIGAIATYDGRVGRVAMQPDSDRDVKLTWADGETSSYIKAFRLTRATEAERGAFEGSFAPPPPEPDDADERREVLERRLAHVRAQLPEEGA